MLIFDFDGVMVNSLDEVLVTAHNAVTGQTNLDLEKIPGPPARLFKRNRFHFQSPGDAVLLMEWCLQAYPDEPEKILSQDEYRHILQAGSTRPLPERIHHFYHTRTRMMQRDIDKWRALNTPFQPLWQALIERGGQRVVLLTNKNREAVLNLCRHFNLDVIGDNVYSGDQGTTKIENFERIMERFKNSHYLFLDDSIKNLRLVETALNREKKLISPLFAGWGYSGPKDMETARESGYPVLTQEKIIDMLDTQLLPYRET